MPAFFSKRPFLGKAYASKLWKIEATNSLRNAGESAARLRLDFTLPLLGWSLSSLSAISRGLVRLWAAVTSRTLRNDLRQK